MLGVSQDFLKLQGRGLQIGSVIFETIIFRIFATFVLCRNTNPAVIIDFMFCSNSEAKLFSL